MILNTPLGPAWADIDDAGAVTAFGFGAPRDGGRGASEVLARQIDEYFAGSRRRFDLALVPRGSEFQKRVWSELGRIECGETISYAELARRVGRPGAARAVGRANATNPIALIVPCHRVIGSDGTLTGYAYGVEIKEKLLRFEATGLLRAGA